MGRIQISIISRMDKQNALCPYNGTLFGNKQEWGSNTYYNTMNLENIMLSKITQTQKDLYCIIPLILNVQSRLINRNRKYISNCQRLGRRRNEEWLLIDTGFLFRGMKILWNYILVMFIQPFCLGFCLKNIELETLKRWVLWYVNYILIKL